MPIVGAAVAEETAAMVAFTMVRHVDGIIVVVCEAVRSSLGAVMLLSRQAAAQRAAPVSRRPGPAALVWNPDVTTSSPDPRPSPPRGPSRGVRGDCARCELDTTDVRRDSGGP